MSSVFLSRGFRLRLHKDIIAQSEDQGEAVDERLRGIPCEFLSQGGVRRCSTPALTASQNTESLNQGPAVFSARILQKIRTVSQAAGGWRLCGSRGPPGPSPRVSRVIRVACVALVLDCAHPVTSMRQTRRHGFEIAERSDGMGSVRAFHDPAEFGGAWQAGPIPRPRPRACRVAAQLENQAGAEERREVGGGHAPPRHHVSGPGRPGRRMQGEGWGAARARPPGPRPSASARHRCRKRKGRIRRGRARPQPARPWKTRDELAAPAGFS